MSTTPRTKPRAKIIHGARQGIVVDDPECLRAGGYAVEHLANTPRFDGVILINDGDRARP